MHHNQHHRHNINPQSDITPQTKFFNPLATAQSLYCHRRRHQDQDQGDDHHPGGVVGQKLMEQKG